jgi:FkbM family methyltransferase
MKVGGYPVLVDLSDRELRYIYFGAFEPSERRFLQQYIRQNDTVVDVGANIGYLSAIVLNQIGESGRLIAFEPNPVIFNRLQNVTKASNGRMQAFNCAVSSKTSDKESDRIKLFVNAGHSMWSSTVEGVSGAGDSEYVFVDTVALADFLSGHGIADVAFVKIDVEGAEADVLDGLIPFIGRDRRPAIMCELVPNGDRWVYALDQLSKLYDHGYLPYRIATSGNLAKIDSKVVRNIDKVENLVFATQEWVDSRS